MRKLLDRPGIHDGDYKCFRVGKRQIERNVLTRCDRMSCATFDVAMGIELDADCVFIVSFQSRSSFTESSIVSNV